MPRVLRRAARVEELVEAFGFRQGIALAARLRRGGGSVAFVDRGRRYVMPNDRSASYHLVESLPKLRDLASFVRPSDGVIIDVGAHAGLFAAFANERAANATIVCIEPDRSLAPIIAANLAGYDKVRIVSAAAMDRPGMVDFYRSALSTQTSSVHREAVDLFQPDALSEPVEATTLDEVADEYASIDVLKLDVQGAESLVLAGASESLRKTRTVLIEATLLDRDLVAALTILRDEFGPWRLINVVASGADLAFERAAR